MLHLVNVFREPSPREVAERQLRDAMRDRLQHASLREYHAAMQKMLEQRIERLRGELDRERPGESRHGG